MNAERSPQPGEVAFYSVLPLVCVPCDWLVCRACVSGQVNDYRLQEKGRFISLDAVELLLHTLIV